MGSGCGMNSNCITEYDCNYTQLRVGECTAGGGCREEVRKPKPKFVLCLNKYLIS